MDFDSLANSTAVYGIEIMTKYKRRQRAILLKRHMAECPFHSRLGRALWKALF